MSRAEFWRRRPRKKKAKPTPLRDAGLRFTTCLTCGDRLETEGSPCSCNLKEHDALDGIVDPQEPGSMWTDEFW